MKWHHIILRRANLKKSYFNTSSTRSIGAGIPVCSTAGSNQWIGTPSTLSPPNQKRRRAIGRLSDTIAPSESSSTPFSTSAMSSRGMAAAVPLRVWTN